ncbi:MAG: Abnormal spindle-like microcephaly-assocd, ASPM-SPD-2-Hydin, partial [Pseudomonadota bacterium]
MLLLAALPLALAFDSEPQPAVFQTQVELFNNLEMSSGPIPSGFPLAVDIGLTANGGGTVRMAGEGVLSWPDGMTFALVPTRDQGTFDVNVDVAAVVNLTYNVGFSGSYPFEVVNFPVAATTTFNPWALGQRVQASQTLTEYEVLSLDYLGITVIGTVTPVVTTGYVTTRWSADGNNVTQPNRTVTLAPDRIAQYPVNVAVAGRFDSTATLNLTGSIQGYGFGPFSYTYPFELSSETVDAEFPVRRLVFPLPMLAADLDAVEFGDVEVGRVDSIEVNLDNDGAMPASGTLTIEGGDGAFAVTPSSFEAPAGGSDVLVVTFAPTDGVPSEARLV